jgi:hypothetical protein
MVTSSRFDKSAQGDGSRGLALVRRNSNEEISWAARIARVYAQASRYGSLRRRQCTFVTTQ